MKKLIIILFIVSAQNFNAQSLDYGNDSQSIKICNALSGNNFSSGAEAANALDKILNVIGASKRFVLQPCDNINNALALTFKGVRYIMYDPEFMQNLSYSNDWNGMFVLAHEVGHHINGHSVDAVLSINDVVGKVPLSKKRIQELEADEFAGFVLGRLGAKLSDATLAVSKTPSGDDSYSTHPTRSKRIAAATRGFKQSGGIVDSNKSVEKGKIIDSKYSNNRYKGVKYVQLDNYYTEAVYKGYVSVDDNKPLGYGVLFFKNGNNYKGEMSGGKYNGYGIFTSSSCIYEGYFVNNAFTGLGKRTCEDNGEIDNIAIGSFSDWQLNGNAKVMWKNTTDEGFYNNGISIKVTRSFVLDSLTTLKSEYGFLDNSNGNGFTTYTKAFNTGTYKGLFSNGRIEGKYGLGYGNNGKNRLLNLKDEELENQLLNNESMHYTFYTSYYNRNIKAVKKGFKKKELSFLHTFIPDIVLSTIDYDIVTAKSGEIKESRVQPEYSGIMLGYAEYNSVSGDSYKGSFKAGSLIKTGYGELLYGNNSEIESYEGIFWDDKFNGYGVLKYKNGKVQSGVFRNGEFLKNEKFDMDYIRRTQKRF
tara:strand:- start:84 stop:1847 length:1764 start_codon:yes stop_codon:yes gene_type:complete